MSKTVVALWAIVFAVGLVTGHDVAAGETLRPNLVVIVADDMGWGDLSLNGNANLRTPHTDSLAFEGASFEHFFVQPVCSPTRAEFLTGRYHPRGGVRGVTSGGERLDLDEQTIADAFQAAGYATACFGKWHNGSQGPYHPNRRGFDEYYGFTSGHWGEYFDPPLDHNGETVRGKGYLADDLAMRAIEFMRLHASGKDGSQKNDGRRPFFCYVAFNTPHSPMQVPDRYWEKFDNVDLKSQATQPERENVEHTRAALAMCENLDDNVGRLLKSLDELNAAQDTIVVFFSDNGPNGARWNGGMRGVKGSPDEGGVRSPLLVRWPARIAAGTAVKPIAAAIDLFPTLTTLAGVPAPPRRPLDGVDLSPLLLGGDAPPAERVLVQHWGGQTSARSQRHRLDSRGRLYDMVVDPGQTRNMAAAEPAEARRLRDAVDRWRREVLAEMPARDDRPFPVGHAAHAATELPARDGEPHGGVARSARPANCSYFTHWNTADDSMTWQVEVLTSGRYEAVVEYTCPAEDVGAEIELTLGDARWTAKIDVTHDPPLRGKVRDRIPRGESYVKDFRPLSLGIVDVPAGRGVMTLRALRVPGDGVGDVRAVTLKRSP